MTELERTTPSVRAFRLAIANFIEARREAKLRGKEDEADAALKYDYETWLADAARRVSQIQAVTHALKATHPDARGSSLHIPPDTLPTHVEIGTHVLGGDFAEDVVGNAAALDVFKFLKIEIEGRRLLDWMRAGEPALRQALHANPDTANEWMAAFGGLVRSDQQPVSHEAAKQVYWCIDASPFDDSAYHLLQPLSASSLSHAIHTDITEARFGEGNKAARQAFRDKGAFDGSYRDYRGLVARKLGGTKPQNISQLNSERGGVNYLLASLPPQWKLERPRSLLNRDSVLEQFAYFDVDPEFESVPTLMKKLVDLLRSNPDNTMSTRVKREAIEQALGQQLSLFAASIHARFEPGWTRDPECRLPLCEQIWLDPERAELPPHEDYAEDDEEFRVAFELGDWPDEVAGRFANWVNEQLRKAGIVAVGDAEYKHWARQAIVEAAWPVPMQRRAGGER